MTDSCPLIWAKTRDRVPYYPLEAHLVDTAAVAQRLCDRWIPERLVERVAERSGVTARDVVGTIVLAAGLHDLGKAGPEFQHQLLGRSKPDEQALSRHSEQLERAGLGKPEEGLWENVTGIEETRKTFRRHEVASAVILDKAYDGAGSTGLASIVAGHHGRWIIPDVRGGTHSPLAAQVYEELFGESSQWTVHHKRIRDMVETVVRVDQRDDTAPMFTPLLTGVVSLADWLASNHADEADYGIDGNSTVDECRDYFASMLDEADGMIDNLIGVPNKPEGTFASVFGWDSKRPVQDYLDRDGEPGLRVVMVPTGDGKTEAALGHWMRNAADRQGIYFALPTMSTANAMWPRVKEFFNKAKAETLGAVQHGMAQLGSAYQIPNDDVTALPCNQCDNNDCDHSGGLRPSGWFHDGTKRALLAPVTVGTVDQVLLAALSDSYNFLRLLGAATKTVVFDEVHSYDPYMTGLLESFLAWAGELNIDVVLLSATMPRERVEGYLEAYTGSTHDVPDPLPYPSVATTTGGASEVVELPTSQRTKGVRVALDYVQGSKPNDVAGHVARLLDVNPGAKVGVIVNTVARCQEIGRHLMAKRPSLDVDIVHSRFPGARRNRQANEVVDSYGKESTNGARVCVATQVVEQSMDLDFDVLVTDLCPMTSLLQRMGRLHRHDHDPSRRTRPSGLSNPEVHVVVPPNLSFDDPKGHGHLPYHAARIRMTWRRSLDSGTVTSIRMPEDVQRLVDLGEVTKHDTTSMLQDATVQNFKNQLRTQRSEANRKRTPLPQDFDNPARALVEFSTWDSDDPPMTRWDAGLMQQQVFLVGGVQTPGVWTGTPPSLPRSSHGNNESKQRRRDKLSEISGCIVNVSGKAAGVAQDQGSERPRSWKYSMFGEAVVVDLDSTFGLAYDPVLGLTIQE